MKWEEEMEECCQRQIVAAMQRENYVKNGFCVFVVVIVKDGTENDCYG